MLTLILRLLGRTKSTETITSSLSTMAQQLRDHAQKQTVAGAALQDKASAIRAQAAATHDDSRKATASAARIEELLGA